jgi:hypothetical protein
MILYHGTKNIINDRYFASETYFTEDIEVAKEYGDVIYKLSVKDDKINCFEKDCFNEHLVSRCLIPMHLFEIV